MTISHIHLKVSNLNRSLEFYRDLVGLQVTEQSDGTAALSPTAQSRPLLTLSELPQAEPKPAGSTGLFHLAIRLPSRLDLAHVFRRLHEHGWPVHGFSDHLVSEALYLPDPDGIGVELYFDQPRETWPWEGDQVAMASRALDTATLLSEDTSDRIPETIHPDTVLGHVHLQVSDLKRAEAFYSELIGLDVMQRSYEGALFLAADGYHHHVAVNAWNSNGGQPPPDDAVGLKSFSMTVRNSETLEAVRQRLEEARINVSRPGGAVYCTDPDGVTLQLLPQET